MTPTLLDTDTLTLLHKHHPQVSLNPFSHPAAVLAADIWADLKRRGLLIGEVDILIASIALSEGLAVDNVSHFTRINSLQMVDWTV